MKKEKPAKSKKTSDHFTATEVGTLIESFRSEIRVIAENHTALDTRLEKIEIAIHGNSRRLDMIELRLDVMDGKIARLEDGLLKLSKDLRDTRQELKNEIHELGTRLDSVKSRL